MTIWNYISYGLWLTLVIGVYIAYNYIFETHTRLKLIWCKIFSIGIALIFAWLTYLI